MQIALLFAESPEQSAGGDLLGHGAASVVQGHVELYRLAGAQGGLAILDLVRHQQQVVPMHEKVSVEGGRIPQIGDTAWALFVVSLSGQMKRCTRKERHTTMVRQKADIHMSNIYIYIYISALQETNCMQHRMEQLSGSATDKPGNTTSKLSSSMSIPLNLTWTIDCTC